MRALITGGYLSDINHLIEMYSNRDYFFGNVLEALEVNGGLYTFPINFVFEYVGINASLPQEFIQRFADYEFISLRQLAILYNDLQDAHSEFEDLAFGINSPVGAGIHEWVCRGVNWRTGRYSVIAPLAFESYVENVGIAFNENNRHGTAGEWSVLNAGNPVGADTLAMLSERYVFSFNIAGRDIANALINFDEQSFVHHILIIGEDRGFGQGAGLLTQRATHNMFSVSTTANGELVMSLLKHMTAAWADSIHGEVQLATPIMRDLFREHAQAGFARAIAEPQIGDVSQIGNPVEDAIARLEVYLEMSVSIPSTLFMLPEDLYNAVVRDALFDAISPAYALQDIQSRVNTWLQTGEGLEIDQATLDARMIAAERAELPERTLSILSYIGYTNIFNQAAEAMNQSWSEQDIPYNLRLEITTFRWTEAELWGERDAQRTRLATMMMAGQGYDIFLVDFNPLWNWSRSGLLTDIWTLIDNDPNVNREDFYEHILDAFAFEDGLWAFPMSFGFEYVGINESLPQSFIDRFAQYDTISVRELMAIYNDLISAYGDSYGHLMFNSGARTSMWDEIMIHELSSFIDYNNKESNLTDPAFVDFLYALRSAFPNADVGSQEWTVGPSLSREWSRNRASGFAFMTIDHSLGTAFGLFPLYEPYFSHFIPLTDDAGRLRMRPNYGGETGIWATLAFPTVGNSALAWEFTQHLMQSMVYPEGRGQFHHPSGTFLMPWGYGSVATPILRSHFNTQAIRGLGSAIERDRLVGIHFDGVSFAPEVHDPETTQQIIDDAIALLSIYNEMPVVIPPFIPDGLRDVLHEILDDFMRGIITGEAAAQQMHNRVSLWLIE